MSACVSLRFQSHALHTAEFGVAKCLVGKYSNQSYITALVIGNIHAPEAPLVRIHSRCLYSEVFGSLDCDCRAQRDLAFRLIKAEGVGVFIYLEQEGRGCGSLNKAKAYMLKETEGLDTVSAYQKLGLNVDPRDYVAAAEILERLGLKRVRLLTNNPNKVSDLEERGITIIQVHLRTKPTIHNIDYLRAKQSKLNHDLGLKGDELELFSTESDH
jgi:3,4-dihydroxy 2-butanone 4-phosphate synthase/GTP cyclohydrolase II